MGRLESRQRHEAGGTSAEGDTGHRGLYKELWEASRSQEEPFLFHMVPCRIYTRYCLKQVSASRARMRSTASDGEKELLWLQSTFKHWNNPFMNRMHKL